MSDNEKSLFWICVILTMGMAFTALMISLPRTVDISNSTRLDYQGTIVAIFALLVTVLIGWQIYNAIGMEKRVFKAEKRISHMLSQIKQTRTAIQSVAQSSEDFIIGVNRLSTALTLFYYTKSNTELPREKVIDNLLNCYALSAKATALFLSSEKADETISPLIDLSVQLIGLSGKNMFRNGWIEITRAALTTEMHDKCEIFYSDIMSYSQKLSVKQINTINTQRTRRLSLNIVE